jgi:hypothetical protein
MGDEIDKTATVYFTPVPRILPAFRMVLDLPQFRVKFLRFLQLFTKFLSGRLISMCTPDYSRG